MFRYENKGYTMEIRLPQDKYKGYSVECRYQYDKNEGKYLISMWILRDTIDDRFKIDSQRIDTQYISGTKETIRPNICRIVEQACSMGYFDSFIRDFDRLYECFDKGFEVLSEEESENNALK